MKRKGLRYLRALGGRGFSLYDFETDLLPRCFPHSAFRGILSFTSECWVLESPRQPEANVALLFCGLFDRGALPRRLSESGQSSWMSATTGAMIRIARRCRVCVRLRMWWALPRLRRRPFPTFHCPAVRCPTPHRPMPLPCRTGPQYQASRQRFLTCDATNVRLRLRTFQPGTFPPFRACSLECFSVDATKSSAYSDRVGWARSTRPATANWTA